MRFKAILAEEARKRYPLSILLIVVGLLAIPFPYLFIHFDLELGDVEVEEYDEEEEMPEEAEAAPEEEVPAE